MLSRKSGRLLARGEPDANSVAKIILADFLRGKIPGYTAPDEAAIEAGGEAFDCEVQGAGKRKRDITDVDGPSESSSNDEAIEPSRVRESSSEADRSQGSFSNGSEFIGFSP